LVVSEDWPHRTLVATERGILATEDLPREQHSGEWAFRSQFSNWANLSTPEFGVSVFDNGRRQVHFTLWLSWPEQIELSWDEDEGKRLEEFGRICISRIEPFAK